jgi:hypothetical protein
MYSEIGFIFSPALKSFGNNNNTGNIYGRTVKIRPAPSNNQSSQGQQTQNNQGQGSQNSSQPDAALQDTVLVYKDPNSTNIVNYLKENVYKYDNSNEDPYISLIDYFSTRKTKALALRAADFAYLKDLGVYPINRLWILRRFPDNCVVPNNLLIWGNAVEPISTVVGWIKDKEDQEFLSVSFHEVWVSQNNWIDKVIGEILNKEFGLAGDKIMSVPGWGQGILFGMLKAMGFTSDFNAFNVATGDPNLLRTGTMRDINNQGLVSKMEVRLETCYEQKYINGVDPGMAMMDIITNLLKMGTSDQKFVLDASSKVIVDFLNQINNKPDLGAWATFLVNLVGSFLEGVKNFISDMTQNGGGAGQQIEGTSETTEKPAPGTIPNPEAKYTQSTSILGNLAKNLGNTLLAGTVYKYRWPLKGTIGLMTGISTTPWHLTVGNPYSPIINIGNIIVNDVSVKLSNDLGFNDMPARIDVNVQIDFGRPLGKQEIEKMFNNGYKRIYAKDKSNTNTSSVVASSNTAASGNPATVNVAANQTQPIETRNIIQKQTGGG